MKAYCAGPMRNITHYNFGAFDAAASELRSAGWEVVNPADFDREMGFDPMTLPDDFDWSELPEGFDMAEIVRRDIKALSECDAIYLLRGWHRSKGARAEFAVAEWLGLMVMYQ